MTMGLPHGPIANPLLAISGEGYSPPSEPKFSSQIWAKKAATAQLYDGVSNSNSYCCCY